MSQAVIKRLHAAIAGSRGVTVELPKAFVVEVLEAMSAAPASVDLDALVRKQREWNDQVIAEYLRSQPDAPRIRVYSTPRPIGVGVKSKCADCGGPTLVIEKRKERRRLMCSHCSRRVTVYGEHLPESV